MADAYTPSGRGAASAPGATRAPGDTEAAPATGDAAATPVMSAPGAPPAASAASTAPATSAQAPRPSPPLGSPPSTVDEKVAQTKRAEAHVLHHITPWLRTDTAQRPRRGSKTGDARRHHPLNPLALFRAQLPLRRRSDSAGADTSHPPHRAPPRSSDDFPPSAEHAFDASPPHGSARWRGSAHSSRNSGSDELWEPRLSAEVPRRLDSKDSSYSSGIELDTNFDSIADIVDRRRVEARGGAHGSLAHPDSLPHPGASGAAAGVPGAGWNTPPLLNVALPTRADAPGGRSGGSPAPLPRLLPAAAAGTHPSSSAAYARPDVSPRTLTADEPPRVARSWRGTSPPRSESPALPPPITIPGAALGAAPALSTYGIPFRVGAGGEGDAAGGAEEEGAPSWAVLSGRDTYATADDAALEDEGVDEGGAQAEAVPTEVIIYELEAPSASSSLSSSCAGDATPNATPEPAPARRPPRFFQHARSWAQPRLDLLLAPELATHAPYTRTHSEDASPPRASPRAGTPDSGALSFNSAEHGTMLVPATARMALSAMGNAATARLRPWGRPGVVGSHRVRVPFLRRGGGGAAAGGGGLGTAAAPAGAGREGAGVGTTEPGADGAAWGAATDAAAPPPLAVVAPTPPPPPPPFEYEHARMWTFQSVRRSTRQGSPVSAMLEAPGQQAEALQPKHFLRVYRTDDTYLLLSCSLETSAAELLHAVARHEGLLETQGYGLFLYEKGGDRPLTAAERPARILRRRLLQMGYTPEDGLAALGHEDMSHILRLVFRADRTLALDARVFDAQAQTYKHLDLHGMHLAMVPVVMYAHAHWIVSLDLSMNPLTDFPRDFAQRCTNLRTLRLCALALKAVPQGVTAVPSLTHLDVSSNRVRELAHIALPELGTLRALRAVNNRLAALPAYTPQLHALEAINLSNNRLAAFPAALCALPQLRDLDLSFNTIGALPARIAQLRSLERLILVGNALEELPAALAALPALQVLDVRRTALHTLGSVLTMRTLATLRASHNQLTVLDADVAPALHTLDLSYNPLSRAHLRAPALCGLTQLNLAHANLARLDAALFHALPALTHLVLDHNQIAALPELSALTRLETLSCAGNALTALPDSLGLLRHLRRLDVQNNNLRALPASLWSCASFLVVLRLADNRLTDEVFSALSLFAELEILNLSMNEIYEVPSGALSALGELRELYLSSNSLSSLPADDLEHLTNLRTLFVNGNKLHSLPAELGRMKRLRALDVGNNVLKYNIANWHYDWNWNANVELRYLNLSGNHRLEIKPQLDGDARERNYADFNRLRHLRLLGLMDVTMTHQPLPDESQHRRVRTTLSHINTVPYGIADTLGMQDELRVFDVVVARFRGDDRAAVYGLVEALGTAHAGSHLAHFVAQHCATFLARELARTGGGQDKGTAEEAERGAGADARDALPATPVRNALQRAFLQLDQAYASQVLALNGTSAAHAAGCQEVFWGWPSAGDAGAERHLWHAGACAIVAYQEGTMLHVANVGNTVGVLCRAGNALCVLGTKHDPMVHAETQRIRAAEGWVSTQGLLNDQLPVARAFGSFHLTPMVTACPSVVSVQLTDADELVILANAELWEYLPYQMAVDIARMDREHPRLASQKLRDIALSYGATQQVAVMVVQVDALFRTPCDTPAVLQRTVDAAKKPARRGRADHDSTLARLDREVLPPIGQVALVFTDIKHSTLLWETNAGMQAAIRQHNLLLRRQLRTIGGYEAKTEGDAFMVSFPTVAAALLWCFSVQLRLLTVDWPQEILDSRDGAPVYDDDGALVYRGLSVRMGVHWGAPVCEVDPVNNRMDYFGPIVNRAARISSAADGGQILVSHDVVRELGRLLDQFREPSPDPASPQQPPIPRDIVFLRRLGLGIQDVGERRLRGIEMAEHLSLVYPKQLSSRVTHLANVHAASAPQLLYEPTQELLELEQVQQMGMLCLRLEALSNGICFPGIVPPHAACALARPERVRVVEHSLARWPELLIIAAREEATDSELLHVLAQLVTRIQNCASTLLLRTLEGGRDGQQGVMSSYTNKFVGSAYPVHSVIEGKAPTGVDLYARFALAGAVCCSVTHGALTPVDVVKTRIQLEPEVYNRGMIAGFRQIVAKEGAGALLTGFGPTLFGYFLQGGFKFGGYELFKKVIVDKLGMETAQRNRMSVYLGASALAEFFADIALCPLEATRIRLVSQPTFANGLLGGFARIAREEGIGGFYAGFGPILFKQVPYNMAKFSTMEIVLENALRITDRKKHELTPGQATVYNLGSGLLAGFAAAFISQPADTLLSKINKTKAQPGETTIGRLAHFSRTLGVRGLFTGLQTRLVMVGTLTALQFAIYGSIKEALGATNTTEISKAQ
ncbi:adenylate cyclase [Malassezia sp. CBS 17886]|nr:adenylate cyclase [Malassezia sp. CBS 17886]